MASSLRHAGGGGGAFIGLEERSWFGRKKIDLFLGKKLQYDGWNWNSTFERNGVSRRARPRGQQPCFPVSGGEERGSNGKKK